MTQPQARQLSCSVPSRAPAGTLPAPGMLQATAGVRLALCIAWRLHSGRWLLQVDCIERLESCAPRVDNQPAVVVREEELGL